MAENKKSFVLYCDLVHTFDKLTDVEAGQLIKHLLAYVNDRSPESDRLIEVMFEPIKQQLKRDLTKYESKRKQWSEAGKASANKRKQTSTDVDSRSTDSTVSVNDSVTDTVTVINNNNGEEENLQTPAGKENPTTEKGKEASSEAEPVYTKNMMWGKRYAETPTQIEHAIKTFKANKLVATKDNVLHMLRMFVSECESKADTKQSFKDFSSHFVSWAKLNPKVQLKPQQVIN